MTKRLFTGIKINPNKNFLTSISDLREEFSEEKIKWVNFENIHLTLKFLGDIKDTEIPGIISTLKDISDNKKSFKIKISDIGAFYTGKIPKVLWFDMKPKDKLINLSSTINTELGKIGISRERKIFNPHITIGRIKYIKNLDSFSEIVNCSEFNFEQSLFVKEFYLFESKLKPQGPEYTIIENFKLKD